MSKDQPVRVNIEELRLSINTVLDDLALTLQGPKDGIEDEHTYGLDAERYALYDAVEEVRGQGKLKAFELMWWDLIGVPLSTSPEHEPGWYLTVTLNADVK